ncbi:DNA mismatch repair endonuclease MutL [Entomobacter blattae]|uniref:DNA mismatch repair protein MutL n=1 Tax=Entomobacter blattae TaxID=2762277 RepID=A0A7H1NUQ3_9PROT|nr:DNA mismatch repair endonuclease MutL [Entomobacter blattae]QNT79513.1 DNA mismatch repair protein MutL [Entomobacter blattae]
MKNTAIESGSPRVSRPVRRLSEGQVNRIAAGEVIERPAAVVKELVENALDAGAQHIAVSLLNGGMDFIEVIDDGSGMGPEDLALAIERHCTSKLEDDTLVKISTLGFRGEALPSIGAAARLAITSRTSNSNSAWKIEVAGGETKPLKPAAGQVGTQVVVENLFFSTPARRKFLKSARVETSHAGKVIERLALAAPDVSFSFTVDGKEVFSLPAQDRLARIKALFSEASDYELLKVEGQKETGLELFGFVSPPGLHRANGQAQCIIVNNRPVTDMVLKTALRVAYQPVLEKGRYPVAVLYLHVPPEQVDVNVHPAKTEVRFSDESLVKSLIIGSIRRVLDVGAGETAGVSAFMFQSKRVSSHMITPPSTSGNARLSNVSEWAHAPLLMREPASIYGQKGAPGQHSLEQEYYKPRSGIPDSGGENPQNEAEGSSSSYQKEDSLSGQEDAPLGYAIAQIMETYIIAVNGMGEMILVDQHAAHERLTHEKLKTQLLSSGQVNAQRLLVPDVINLSNAEMRVLVEFQQVLLRLGVEIEAFGGNAILVRAVPVLLAGGDTQSLMRDIAAELLENPELDLTDSGVLLGRMEEVIASMACHGSIRAGRPLKYEEMNALLRQMEQTPRAGTCSHGRPTWVKITKKDMEKIFGRQ